MLGSLPCRRQALFFCSSRNYINLRTHPIFGFFEMTRRPHCSASPSESPRLSKRPKLEHLTSQDFKGGVFLAPMVRSGARMFPNNLKSTLPEISRCSAHPSIRLETWCQLGLGPGNGRQGHFERGKSRRS
jgi:hypothetical protein